MQTSGCPSDRGQGRSYPCDLVLCDKIHQLRHLGQETMIFFHGSFSEESTLEHDQMHRSYPSESPWSPVFLQTSIPPDSPFGEQKEHTNTFTVKPSAPDVTSPKWQPWGFFPIHVSNPTGAKFICLWQTDPAAKVKRNLSIRMRNAEITHTGTHQIPLSVILLDSVRLGTLRYPCPQHQNKEV